MIRFHVFCRPLETPSRWITSAYYRVRERGTQESQVSTDSAAVFHDPTRVFPYGTADHLCFLFGKIIYVIKEIQLALEKAVIILRNLSKSTFFTIFSPYCRISSALFMILRASDRRDVFRTLSFLNRHPFEKQPECVKRAKKPMNRISVSKRTSIEYAVYAMTAFLCIFLLVVLLGLWNADLTIPFVYSEDGLFYSMVIKGMSDNGWYLHNSLLGMPSGMDLHDFPLVNFNTFHLFMLKLISLLFHNYGTTMNLYYLLTFPLTTITSLFVFRQFNLSFVTSIVGSLLFTFLPYHFMRGEHHFFLASYYMIPPMVMVILWLSSEKGLLFIPSDDGGKPRLDLTGKETLISIGSCLVVASSDVYYAFFSSFFLFIAGLLASVAKKKIYPLLACAILVFVISGVVLLQAAPSIVYQHKHGKNREAAHRSPVDAEIYGMKIAQLLLPVSGHRVPCLARLKQRYNSEPYRPLINENDSSSLGLLGSLGFLMLLLSLLNKSPRDSHEKIKNDLAVLNVSAVLLGTIGGLGSLFAFFVLPQIRSYNRISLFIAFFSLFAVVIFLENIRHRYVKSRKDEIRYYLLMAVTLAIGIADQTTAHFRPPFAELKAEYAKDEEFVRKIEASLPENAMIFQLPYVAFPESWPVHKMMDYELFRGYMHSKTLRWSYGAMKGREGDAWQKHVVNLPSHEFLTAISDAGFSGIYLDRYGFADRGVEIEGKLSHWLSVEPIVNDNGRLVFFNMGRYTDGVRTIAFDVSRVKRGTTTGNVDLIESHKSAKGRSAHLFHAAGWAFDLKRNIPVRGVLIVYDSRPLTVAPVTHPRNDVAQAYQNEKMLMTGWDTVFWVNSIHKDPHKVEFYSILEDEVFVPLPGQGGNKAFVIPVL